MEMQELGYNCHLTDFQAALCLSQLKQANEEGLQKRKEIARRHDEAFAGILKTTVTNDARSANDPMTAKGPNDARSANEY